MGQTGCKIYHRATGLDSWTNSSGHIDIDFQNPGLRIRWLPDRSSLNLSLTCRVNQAHYNLCLILTVIIKPGVPQRNQIATVLAPFSPYNF